MTLKHDLGTFEGFNFREQAALDRNVTADELLDWDHDGTGSQRFTTPWVWTDSSNPSWNRYFVDLVFVLCQCYRPSWNAMQFEGLSARAQNLGAPPCIAEAREDGRLLS